MISKLLTRLSAASLLILFGQLINPTTSHGEPYEEPDIIVTGQRQDFGFSRMGSRYNPIFRMDNIFCHYDDFGWWDPQMVPPNPKDRNGDGKMDCWRDLTNDPLTRLSDLFNANRGPNKPRHRGLDVAAECGKRVFSLGNGVVVRIGYDPALNGYYVGVNDDNGNQIMYINFESSSQTNEAGLSIGDRVSVGQLIGFVGDTGSVDGCHVHVEVVENYRENRRAPSTHARIDPLEEYGGPDC